MPKTKILIVEDEAITAMDLQNSLKRLGYDAPAIVPSGERAIKKAEELKPDLVLMDIELQGAMDGIEAAGMIRNLQDIPVVFLTAYADETRIESAKLTDPYGYIIKPFKEKELRPLIELALYKHGAEKRLREREHEYQTILNSVPASLFHIDTNSVFVQVNEVLAKRYGLKPGEFKGKTTRELFPEDADGYIKSDNEVRETKEPQIGTTREITTPEGLRWVRLDKVPIKDAEGNVTGIIGLELDVTESKRAEEGRKRLVKELEAKNAELERFTYTVSHDLGAPLLSIQGFANILREDLEHADKKNVETDLTWIEKSAAKMAILLNDTLQLSRIGRVTNPPEDVPFADIVKEALEQTTEQLKTSNVEITVADALPAVHVDRMRIAEVLVNLITNSTNYMGEQSHPEIEIGVRADGEETVFFVKDTGKGIDKSQHEKVFELFYKEDESSKGTGAGLAIVKRIIEVHGGRIWIESETGKGCTVCFTLPLS